MADDRLEVVEAEVRSDQLSIKSKVERCNIPKKVVQVEIQWLNEVLNFKCNSCQSALYEYACAPSKGIKRSIQKSQINELFIWMECMSIYNTVITRILVVTSGF